MVPDVHPGIGSSVSLSRVLIGAGEQRWDGWIATQKEELDLLDGATFELFFQGSYADAFVSEHTWEHLTIDEGIDAAKLCYRFLRPGGLLRVAVPDGRFPDEEYQRNVQVGGPGPPDHPASDHRVVYLAETLSDVLFQAGFQVNLLEWWDAAGQFQIRAWSTDDGPIYRSSLLDHRNQAFRDRTGPPGFTSIIVDAIRPEN
jgi:predicted SAM-dependent methyltransferase